MNSKRQNMKKHKCERCGYEWMSKLEKPKACPRCKRYDWHKSGTPDKWDFTI